MQAVFSHVPRTAPALGKKVRERKAKMKYLVECENNHMKGLYNAVKRHEYKL